MDKRVQVQQRATTQDASGDQAHTWITLATMWAGIEPVTGRELTASAQVVGRVPTRFILRHRSDLTVLPSMRILWGARVYEIESASLKNGRAQQVDVSAVELVGEAA